MKEATLALLRTSAVKQRAEMLRNKAIRRNKLGLAWRCDRVAKKCQGNAEAIRLGEIGGKV